MIRLGAALVWLIVAGAALGQRAANAPAVADAAVAKAMTAAARTLLESVRGDPEFSERLRSYSMEDKLLLTLDAPEREKWAYWPTERSGLSFDLMHAKHRTLTHELLWLLLSNRGYHKLLNIMQLENVLQPTSGTGFPRGIEDYSLTLFGEPSDTVPWAWRFEGHHISLSITVVPGQGFTVTPTFLGSDPAEVTFGPLAGLRVLRVEEDLGLQLANSLTAAQLRTAVVPGTPDWNAQGGFAYPGDVPWDIVAATILRDRSDWNTWKTELQPDGIAFKDLNGAQQAALLGILDEIFTTYRPEIADTYRESLDLDGLRFAWIGGLKRSEPHYYRVQTRDFLFEFDNVQGNANHIHEVWRSRAGDFGEDLLRRHRAAEH
ncbi:MAG TPA: DUF3500 domain-containing protein [Gammaproteobacteria bacterium]|nr:DUF3500 domain-containing protein [Gammaproteobacteria bacterium]